MPSISHVQRRGAVYYWRRRLPKVLSKPTGCSYLVLSLGTKDQAIARRIAAILDSEAVTMVDIAEGMTPADHRVSGDQIKGIFRDVAQRHLAKFDRVAEFDRLQPNFTVQSSRRIDICMGHVYRLLATQGAGAAVDETTATTLRGEGLTPDEIASVSHNLFELRRNNMTLDHPIKLEALLSAVGAVSSPINRGIAQTTKHRAMAAALFDTGRRWDGQFGDDAVLLHTLTQAQATGLPPAQRVDPEHPSVPVEVRLVPESQATSSSEPQIEREFQTPLPDDRVVVLVESLLENRMKNVADKTKRQVCSAGKLFSKYLLEVHGVAGLRALRQSHIAGFVGLLQNEAYVNHGNSEHDEGRSIAELRAIWKTKPKAQIGIDRATAQRWVQQLSQILQAAPAAGITLDRDLTFKNLVVSKSDPTRARYARPTMKVAQSGALFRQPPFTGCFAWNAICEPGKMIFHGAIFFATMLIHYDGERREEICGALASDVVTDNGPIPYLYVVNNKFRRIKNLQSNRVIAIHPELIRLGFFDYVAVIKALGYELLFPDLYSPTTQSPLGDRYHDVLRPVLDLAGITEKGTGSHSARRGFGNNLKQQGVDAEKRAELLGHGGDTETTERYCDPYEVKILYEAILKLPIVTGHLEPTPITLIPWVKAMQTAPFSQPSRTKEAKKIRREPRL